MVLNKVELTCEYTALIHFDGTKKRCEYTESNRRGCLCPLEECGLHENHPEEGPITQSWTSSAANVCKTKALVRIIPDWRIPGCDLMCEERVPNVWWTTVRTFCHSPTSNLASVPTVAIRRSKVPLLLLPRPRTHKKRKNSRNLMTTWDSVSSVRFFAFVERLDVRKKRSLSCFQFVVTLHNLHTYIHYFSLNAKQTLNAKKIILCSPPPIWMIFVD